MTIEEQITIFEHNAEHERKEGDLNNCLHFRQLAEWMKELQIYRRNLTNQSISDLLVQSENENERLHNRMNELEKELQNHKEAWERCIKEIKGWYWNVDKQAIAKDPCVVDAMIDLFIRTIKECRPKEGDSGETTK